MNFLGLTFEKILILGVIAAVIVGPTRLPDYAQKLAQFIRNLKGMAQGASTRVKDEMGPEFDEVDWRKLDPRQYDPRRIIKEALLDDGGAAPTRVEGAPLTAGAVAVAAPALPARDESVDDILARRRRTGELTSPAPVDDEAT